MGLFSTVGGFMGLPHQGPDNGALRALDYMLILISVGLGLVLLHYLMRKGA